MRSPGWFARKASPACCGLPRYGWPLLTPKSAFVIGRKADHPCFRLDGGNAPEAVIPPASLGGSVQPRTVVRRRLSQTGGPALPSPLVAERGSREPLVLRLP